MCDCVLPEKETCRSMCQSSQFELAGQMLFEAWPTSQQDCGEAANGFARSEPSSAD